MCQQFDNGAFLAEELTISCDGSTSRSLWVAFAAISLVVYVLGVPTLMFTAMYHQRHAIKKLGLELECHNNRRGAGLNIAQFAKSKHARSSFASLTVEMQWLLPQFEEFTPAQWYTGTMLLVIRLVQTSLMALVPSQFAQAAIMCCVTLVAILLQSELSPYRRASDNHVALLSQVLVFTWVFILMVRIAGLFEKPAAATAIGVLLCVATVAVFVSALVLANIDRLNEKRAEQSNLNTAEAVELTIKESENETGEKEPEEVEAGSQGRESLADASDEEKFEEQEYANASSALPWSSILSIGGGAFCGAETSDRTADSNGDESVGNGADEATALMRRIEKLSTELAIKDKKRIREQLKTMISMMDDSS